MTTNERFVADNEYVLQNGKVYVVCGGKHSSDVVASALNELMEENERLNLKVSYIQTFADKWGINIYNIPAAFRKCRQDNMELVKENKELKNNIALLEQKLQKYDAREVMDNDEYVQDLMFGRL